jgi:phosphate starvation-inducible PhoH-like protein
MTKTTNRKKAEPEVRLDKLQGVFLKERQVEYKQTITDNKVTFCHGPAGTSKTFTTIYTALQLLAEEKIKHIILTKPIQESGEKLGFLPGSVDEKIMPFMESYRDSMNIILGKQKADWLFTTECIRYEPLAYMRGRTFHDSMMILDEAQNADFRQLMLFISRMGKNSKVVVSGDVSQYDIERNKVALPNFVKMLEGIDGIASFEFYKEDIMRDKILIEITDRYEKWKSENGKL